MIITPTVNYRDLLRRVVCCLPDAQVAYIQQDTFLFSEEERKVLEELNDRNVQDT